MGDSEQVPTKKQFDPPGRVLPVRGCLPSQYGRVSFFVSALLLAWRAEARRGGVAIPRPNDTGFDMVREAFSGEPGRDNMLPRSYGAMPHARSSTSHYRERSPGFLDKGITELPGKIRPASQYYG